jgi:hypothetical protein
MILAIIPNAIFLMLSLLKIDETELYMVLVLTLKLPISVDSTMISISKPALIIEFACFILLVNETHDSPKVLALILLSSTP